MRLTLEWGTAVGFPVRVTIADIAPRTALQQRYWDPALTEPAQWNPVLEALHSHRSVRRYLPDPLTDETLDVLVLAAQSAATSSNLQAWSVVAVRDPRPQGSSGRARGRAGSHRRGPRPARSGSPTSPESASSPATAQQPPRRSRRNSACLLTCSRCSGSSSDIRIRTPTPRSNRGCPRAAVLHHEKYDLPAQRDHVDAYEGRIAAFYSAQQLDHFWIERVLDRLASRRG